MIRLAVRVAAEQAELVLVELLELAPGGVEEAELEGGVTEYAIYGAPGELPELPVLTAAAGGALVEIASQEVPDDWEERWRRFHRPLVIGDRLTVRPPWEPSAATELDLVIDPGRAFGTGAHATTRLCLELLLDLPAGGTFIDLGCGSGVLAVAAARLGYSPVRAFDLDPAALDATRANAEANGVQLDEVRQLDLRTEEAPLEDSTVAANLLAPLLRTLAGRLSRARGLPERLIASGLLHGERASVAGAFCRDGLRLVTRRRQGDWEALLLER